MVESYGIFNSLGTGGWAHIIVYRRRRLFCISQGYLSRTSILCGINSFWTFRSFIVGSNTLSSSWTTFHQCFGFSYRFRFIYLSPFCLFVGLSINWPCPIWQNVTFLVVCSLQLVLNSRRSGMCPRTILHPRNETTGYALTKSPFRCYRTLGTRELLHLSSDMCETAANAWRKHWKH